MNRLRIVHVPGLERLPDGVDALPSDWHRLLSRAQPLKTGPAGPLAALIDQELPSPAILARLCIDTAEVESAPWWLRFDAVSMRPDLSSVWVERRLSVDFAAPQFSELHDELAAMFSAEGLLWRPVPAMGCGLVPLPEAPDVEFQGLSEVEGARLDEILPTGADASRWRRLINESQMIFHQFRPLSASDPRGAGLWFWGGGAWPPSAPSANVKVSSPHPDGWTRALARWLRSDVETRSTAWLTKRSESTRLLIAPIDKRDATGSLEAVFTDWLKPLGGASFIVAGDRIAWRINAMDRLSFWRGRRLTDWPEPQA